MSTGLLLADYRAPIVLPVPILAIIPTLLYTAIYFGERQKYRRRRQVERMNIQDLG